MTLLSYTAALRKLVLSREGACLAIYRIGGGTDSGIAEALNNMAKLSMALRSMRLTIPEIERLLAPLVKPGMPTPPATWSQVEEIKMAHAVNTGVFSK